MPYDIFDTGEVVKPDPALDRALDRAVKLIMEMLNRIDATQQT
jgi:hypothetical protein